ncbi:MAG: class I SAM-dependent methyltransferase, partial [Erysipelotrichaceae bacterium]|nr:class I SAM-dependent methyltransferase [Erysipelotrichaceae bacterium]
HDTFETVEYKKESFDGIWASASLLHVVREDMIDVLNKLHSFLKPDGTLYVSYKLREEDFSDGMRQFTCYTEESFKELIDKTSLQLMELEVTKDTRVGRDDELWINAYLKK